LRAGLPALVPHPFAELSVFVFADFLTAFLDDASHKSLRVYCRYAGSNHPPFDGFLNKAPL
jgi:hypothetical protein